MASMRVTAKYNGPSTRIRRISKADFKKAGVDGVKTDLEWSPDNDFTVDVSDLPEGAIKILEKDKGFDVTREEEKSSGSQTPPQQPAAR